MSFHFQEEAGYSVQVEGLVKREGSGTHDIDIGR